MLNGQWMVAMLPSLHLDEDLALEKTENGWTMLEIIKLLRLLVFSVLRELYLLRVMGEARREKQLLRKVQFSKYVYEVLENVLLQKEKAENVLIKYYTNMNWTIIWPGGLISDTPSGKAILTEDTMAIGSISWSTSTFKQKHPEEDTFSC
ncbi:hypothetical protein ACHAWX_004361 [Stephanocyclus meneghinianus]